MMPISPRQGLSSASPPVEDRQIDAYCSSREIRPFFFATGAEGSWFEYGPIWLERESEDRKVTRGCVS